MESALIAWLRQRLPAHPLLRLGPGDDAAVVGLPETGECVTTVDLFADGVHFHLARDGAGRVGHKALGASLSDLAAMAARPRAALVALLLPREGGRRLGEELIEGMLGLADRHAVAIAGGDTNSWPGPLVVSVTAIGEPAKRGPLLRGGGRAGDRLVVTGELGGSGRGKHLDVEPRVDEALLLHDRYDLSAGIDLSDGLAIDASRLATESGCGAVLNADSVPVSDMAREMAAEAGDRQTPLQHALGDGEDFELLLAAAPGEAARMLDEQPLGVPLTDIGELVAGPGLSLREAGGRVGPLKPVGFEHEMS